MVKKYKVASKGAGRVREVHHRRPHSRLPAAPRSAPSQDEWVDVVKSLSTTNVFLKTRTTHRKTNPETGLKSTEKHGGAKDNLRKRQKLRDPGPASVPVGSVAEVLPYLDFQAKGTLRPLCMRF